MEISLPPQLLPSDEALRRAEEKDRRMRRLLWVLTAAMAVVAAVVGVAWIPVDYVIQSPGPTVNVLGSQGETTVLEVSQSGGTAVFDIPENGGSDGELLMVTVSSLGGPGTKTRVGNLVASWFNPGDSVVPYSDLYAPETTAEDVKEAGAAQMESSHSAASIAALEYLGVPMETTMTVAGFSKGSKAADVLEVEDVLVSITTPDGVIHPVDSPSVPFRLMEVTAPNSIVLVTVVRAGKEVTVEVPTVAPSQAGLAQDQDSGDDRGDGDEGEGDEGEEVQETGSRMGIYLSADTNLPLDVTIHLERIGGPSAGLAFALGIIDELTPHGIIGDSVVAATGALDFSGNTVAIGGVKQKMYGAVRDGAKWFLVPTGNCEDVVGNIPDGLQVVSVATLAQGVEAVEAIRDGNTQGLARCEGDTYGAGSQD